MERRSGGSVSEPAVVRVVPPRSEVPLKDQEFVPKATMKRSGLWLRAARKARELSVRELADLIGVSENYIGRVESGVRYMGRRGDLLNRLAVTLDVDAREVWRQMQPTAPELDFKETLASIESMASALTTAKGDTPTARRFRTIGRAILNVLKGGER